MLKLSLSPGAVGDTVDISAGFSIDFFLPADDFRVLDFLVLSTTVSCCSSDSQGFGGHSRLFNWLFFGTAPVCGDDAIDETQLGADGEGIGWFFALFFAIAQASQTSNELQSEFPAPLKLVLDRFEVADGILLRLFFDFDEPSEVFEFFLLTFAQALHASNDLQTSTSFSGFDSALGIRPDCFANFIE